MNKPKINKPKSGKLPAFPATQFSRHPDYQGLTLRDVIAIAAMQARLSLKDGRTRDEIVEDSWDDSDAMLRHREKSA